MIVLMTKHGGSDHFMISMRSDQKQSNHNKGIIILCKHLLSWFNGSLLLQLLCLNALMKRMNNKRLYLDPSSDIINWGNLAFANGLKMFVCLLFFLCATLRSLY